MVGMRRAYAQPVVAVGVYPLQEPFAQALTALGAATLPFAVPNSRCAATG